MPDTSSVNIMLPMADYAALLPSIHSALDSNFLCAIPKTSFCVSPYVSCDNYLSKLPTLTFTIDSTEYKLPPQAYAYSYLNSGPTWTDACMIQIQYNMYSQDTVLLGLPFINQYVPTFDFSKNTVSFGVSVGANPGVLVVNHMSSGAIAGIVVGAVAAVAIIAVVAIKCRKK